MKDKDLKDKGFLKIDGVLKRDDVESVLEKIKEIKFDSCDEFIEERNGKPKQLQNLHKYDEKFFIDTIFGKIKNRIVDLTGKEPYEIKNVQIFVKYPNQSGITKPHQDDWYFKMPEDKFALTCWIALDDVDEDHGCISYVPKSHHYGLLVHENNSNGKWRVRSGVSGYAGYINIPKEKFQNVPVKMGDMIVHHGRTIHYAKENIGVHIRRALTFILFFDKSNTK